MSKYFCEECEGNPQLSFQFRYTHVAIGTCPKCKIGIYWGNNRELLDEVRARVSSDRLNNGCPRLYNYNVLEDFEQGSLLVLYMLNQASIPLLVGMKKFSETKLAELRVGFNVDFKPTRPPTPGFLRQTFDLKYTMLMFNSEVWISGVINRMKANHCVPLTVLSRQRLITVAVARVILLMVGKKCLTDETICKAFDEVVYTEAIKELKL